MKGMILQLIVVASGVSSFVERKITWYCSVVYVMSNFKNFKTKVLAEQLSHSVCPNKNAPTTFKAKIWPGY